jgi:hypothetical protein
MCVLEEKLGVAKPEMDCFCLMRTRARKDRLFGACAGVASSGKAGASAALFRVGNGFSSFSQRWPQSYVWIELASWTGF